MTKIWKLEKKKSMNDINEELKLQIEEENKLVIESYKENSDNSTLKELVDKFNLNIELIIESSKNISKEDWILKTSSKNYKEFCNSAKDIIQKNPDEKYKVIVQQVDIDGHVISSNENKGVLNYLRVTLTEREPFTL